MDITGNVPGDPEVATEKQDPCNEAPRETGQEPSNENSHSLRNESLVDLQERLSSVLNKPPIPPDGNGKRGRLEKRPKWRRIESDSSLNMYRVTFENGPVELLTPKAMVDMVNDLYNAECKAGENANNKRAKNESRPALTNKGCSAESVRSAPAELETLQGGTKAEISGTAAGARVPTLAKKTSSSNSSVGGSATNTSTKFIRAPGKSSSYHGVSWHTQRRRWRAYIYLSPGKQKYLGTFEDQRAAAEAYDKAVLAYGLRSPLNFGTKSTQALNTEANRVAISSANEAGKRALLQYGLNVQAQNMQYPPSHPGKVVPLGHGTHAGIRTDGLPVRNGIDFYSGNASPTFPGGVQMETKNNNGNTQNQTSDLIANFLKKSQEQQGVAPPSVYDGPRNVLHQNQLLLSRLVSQQQPQLSSSSTAPVCGSSAVLNMYNQLLQQQQQAAQPNGKFQ